MKIVTDDELEAWAVAKLTSTKPGMTTPEIARAMGVRWLEIVPGLVHLAREGVLERTLVANDGGEIGTDYDADDDDVGIWHWRLLAKPIRSN